MAWKWQDCSLCSVLWAPSRDVGTYPSPQSRPATEAHSSAGQAHVPSGSLDSGGRSHWQMPRRGTAGSCGRGMLGRAGTGLLTWQARQLWLLTLPFWFGCSQSSPTFLCSHPSAPTHPAAALHPQALRQGVGLTRTRLARIRHAFGPESRKSLPGPPRASEVGGAPPGSCSSSWSLECLSAT